MNSTKSIRNKISSLCLIDWENDLILNCFSKLSAEDITFSLKSYSKIVKTLLDKGQSLSKYLHGVLLFTDIPTVNHGEFQSFATSVFEHDYEILRELAELPPAKVKSMILDPLGNEFRVKLSDYPRGVFEWEVNYFLEKHKAGEGGIFAQHKAYRLSDGDIIPVCYHDEITLKELKSYTSQREKILQNTKDFIDERPAANALLYGDRGTGKSSTVKALLNEFDELRMIQLTCYDIIYISSLYEKLVHYKQKFILFIDDLTFAEDDMNYSVLKASLEGSLSAKPINVLIYATTNRRHIIKENSSLREGGEMFLADAIDESVSLSERFGLFLTFGKPDKVEFLEITRKIAQDRGLKTDLESVFDIAEKFAIRRGGRSPRIARHAIDYIEALEKNDDKTV